MNQNSNEEGLILMHIILSYLPKMFLMSYIVLLYKDRLIVVSIQH